MQDKPIKTLSTTVVYKNRWASIREDIIERANGERGLYAVMDKGPACIIIPLQGDTLTLVHQYRYPVEASFYEFPQGGWETVPNAQPEDLARGELREETGLTAGKLTLIGTNWIAYGAMHQIHYVWLAEDLTQGEPDLEAEEHGLTTHQVTVEEFEAMILDGRIMDNCTISAWGTYLIWQRNKPR